MRLTPGVDLIKIFRRNFIDSLLNAKKSLVLKFTQLTKK